MIHYMLLPKEEMKLLRKEYRLRFFIVLLFFVSCAIVVGIIALIPSYLKTEQELVEAALLRENLLKNQKESGADIIEKDLLQSQILAEKIIEEMDPNVHSEVIEKIISRLPRSVSLTSFQFTREAGTSTPLVGVIQGRAETRESLLGFKKELEKDVAFSLVEVPLSDLAKSRNIFFTINLNIKRK